MKMLWVFGPVEKLSEPGTQLSPLPRTVVLDPGGSVASIVVQAVSEYVCMSQKPRLPLGSWKRKPKTYGNPVLMPLEMH